MNPSRLVVLFLLTVACLALGRASGANAEVVVVMNTNDSATGSLRQAIADATTGTGILFDVSIQGETIELDSPLVIDKLLAIDGSAAGMTLKAVNNTRVLETSSDMNLANLKLDGGETAGKGGAVLHTFGQFNFHDASIKNSTAGTDGGGIYVGTDGDAILTNVLIDGNSAGRDGGGIYAETFVSMDLELITVTNNEAADRGGGVFLDEASPVLEGVTIADNMAAKGGGIFSNGFFGLTAPSAAITPQRRAAASTSTRVRPSSATPQSAVTLQPPAAPSRCSLEPASICTAARSRRTPEAAFTSAEARSTSRPRSSPSRPQGPDVFWESVRL